MELDLAKLVRASVAEASGAACLLGSGHADVQAECEADPLPHEGFVVCDKNQNGQDTLAHNLTGQRKFLPVEGFPWELRFVKGFGVRFPGNDPNSEGVFMDDLLTHRVYVPCR